MNPITSIGEFKITVADGALAGEDFFFKPSFSNLLKLGSPREIVELYAILNGIEINNIITKCFMTYGHVPDYIFKTIKTKTFGSKILSAAMRVMDACCYSDATPLIGYYKDGNKGMIYCAGLMPVNMIISNAHNLMEHGVIGKANFQVAQRDETGGGYSYEFDPMDYVDSARIHFGMNKNEALDLSMTEFHRLLKQKYPERKGLTRDEYDQVADDYFAAREEKRRLIREAKLNG